SLPPTQQRRHGGHPPRDQNRLLPMHRRNPRHQGVRLELSQVFEHMFYYTRIHGLKLTQTFGRVSVLAEATVQLAMAGIPEGTYRRRLARLAGHGTASHAWSGASPSQKRLDTQVPGSGPPRTVRQPPSVVVTWPLGWRVQRWLYQSIHGPRCTV